MPEHRIVSLVPSATEIVAALGRGRFLVGRSHECDYPPETQSAPVLTSVRVDARATSSVIDRSVRAALVEGLSLYSVDTGLLGVLRPDLIFTQDQCSVCAVSNADLEAAVARIRDANPRIVTISATSLDGIWNDIRRVGGVLDAPDEAERLIGSLQDRVRDVERRTDPIEDRPSVVCLEWLDPPMAAGHWIPELVGIAGGKPLLCEPGRRAPRVAWSDIVAADPDVLILMPCGIALERVRSEAAAVLPQPVARSLRAVKEGRVFLADGSALFNRPGPRIVDSLEILAEMLHPDLFAYGHPGWERL